jgi:hypothetical protein
MVQNTLPHIVATTQELAHNEAMQYQREKLTVIWTLKLFKGMNRQSVMNSDYEEFRATSAFGA